MDDRPNVIVLAGPNGAGKSTVSRTLLAERYGFDLFYLWVRSADVSVQRVKERVGLGGHFVPEDTIRRRYGRGLKNFITLYRPLADTWRLIDNSELGFAGIIADMDGTIERVNDPSLWEALQKGAVA